MKTYGMESIPTTKTIVPKTKENEKQKHLLTNSKVVFGKNCFCWWREIFYMKWTILNFPNNKNINETLLLETVKLGLFFFK